MIWLVLVTVAVEGLHAQHIKEVLHQHPMAPGTLDTPTNHADSNCKSPVFNFRLEERIHEAVVVESGDPNETADATLQVWPPAKDARPPSHGPTTTVTIADQVLTFVTDGPGYVTLPEGLGVYTPTVDSIMLKLKVSGPDTVQIAWRHRLLDWEEMVEIKGYSLNLPLTRTEDMHTYVVRMDNLEDWQQYRTVDGIRILTEETATVTVERVEIHKHRNLFTESGVGAREYAISGDVRQTLFMHTPATLKYKLRLPEHPVFTAGLAMIQHGNPTVFQLTVVQDGTKTVVMDENVSDANIWTDRRINLEAFSGQEIELVLTATSNLPGQVGLWSNPSIYQPAPKTLPNILVYLVDALRADHLSAYGYELDTSPFLRTFAESGTLFQQCFAQETCTKPSVMTLHTGIDSLVHGYICNHKPAFSDELPLFPARFRELGYSTGAISQNSYAPPISFTQKTFCQLVELHEVEISATGDTYQAASEFLEQNHDRPFYLYIHTMECHQQWTPPPGTSDYTPPVPLDKIWENPGDASLTELYDASIAFADYNFERIRRKLEDLGLLEDTLIIFTSDHGYALGERDEWAHGRDPYQDQIHIPLIMSWPGGTIPSRTRIFDYVQTVDLAPTILEVVGLTGPDFYQGNSLIPLMQGSSDAFTSRPIFSFNGWMSDAVSLIRDQWKLLRSSEKIDLLFSLADSSRETHDLSEAHPDTREELRQVLKRHIQRHTSLAKEYQTEAEPDEASYIDPVKLEILQSLGYLGN